MFAFPKIVIFQRNYRIVSVRLSLGPIDPLECDLISSIFYCSRNIFSYLCSNTVIICFMFEIASDDLVNAVLYNVPDYQAYSEEGDPRGLGSDMGVIVSDLESSDWLAENIFNVSADGIAEAVAAAESENSMYAEGDKYYGLLVRTGMGMAPSVDIKECAQDGNVYDLTADFSVNGSYTATAHAKAEIKNINGTWYWTLHSYSAD